MEENFDLEEEKLDNNFVLKDDFVFKRKKKEITEEKKKILEEVKKVIDEANKVDLKSVNVFDKNTISTKERKSININDNIINDNVINNNFSNDNNLIIDNVEDNVENNFGNKYINEDNNNINELDDDNNINTNLKQNNEFKSNITVSDNDPIYDELINKLSTEPIQKFDYNSSNLKHAEKVKTAKDMAYQNITKLLEVYKKVVEVTSSKGKNYENTEDAGIGFTIDGREVLNMSYVIALENKNLSERDYARLVLSMFEAFRHDYSTPAFNEKLKEFINEDVKHRLTEYADTLDEKESEDTKYKKDIVIKASKGIIDSGSEDTLCDILSFDLKLKVPTKNDIDKDKNLPDFLKKTLPTVNKYFEFENDTIKNYNFMDSTSVEDEQKMLTFALQEQAFAVKHNEFNEYLTSEEKTVEYYQEKDNQSYVKQETQNKIINEFKGYNLRGLSKETIGVEEGMLGDPLRDKFYSEKSSIPEYFANKEIIKLPVDNQIYRFANQIKKIDKLNDKDKLELFNYLDASALLFEETNLTNTNGFKTARRYNLNWDDLIFIDGESLRELSKGQRTVLKDPNKKGSNKTTGFSSESLALKYLFDALINKNQNVSIAKLHSSDDELSVEVRPLYFEFNQKEYEKANKLSWFSSTILGNTIVDKNKEQESLWNARSFTFQDEKAFISNKLIKKVMEREPEIIQISGRTISNEVKIYQMQKLAEQNLSQEEINKIVSSHGTIKRETVDLSLNKNESLDDSKVFDVKEPVINNDNIINNNIIKNEEALDINTNSNQLDNEKKIDNQVKADLVLDAKAKALLEQEKKLEEQKAKQAEDARKLQESLKNKINNSYRKAQNGINPDNYLRLIDLKLNDPLYKEEDIYSNDSKYSLNKLLSGINIDLNSEIQEFRDFNNNNSLMNNECTILKNDSAYDLALKNVDKLSTIFRYIHSRLKEIDEHRFSNLVTNNGIMSGLDGRDIHTMSYIYAIENPNITVKQYAELVTSLFMVYTHDYRHDKNIAQSYYDDLMKNVTDDVKKKAVELKEKFEKEMKENPSIDKNYFQSKIATTLKFIQGNYKVDDSNCVSFVLRELGIPYKPITSYIMDKKADFLERVRPSAEMLQNYCKTISQNLDNLDTNTTMDAERVIVHYLQGQAVNTKYREFYEELKTDRTLKEFKDDDKIKYQEGLLESRIVNDMRARKLNTSDLATVTIGGESGVENSETTRLYNMKNVVADAVGKMEGNTLNLPLDEGIYRAAELINKADNNDINQEELEKLQNYISNFSFNYSGLLCPNTNEYATASKFRLDETNLIYLDGKPLKSYTLPSKELTQLEHKTGLKFTPSTYRSYLMIKTICKYPKKINYVRLHSTNTKLQYEIIKVKPQVDQKAYLASNPQARGIKERWRRLFGKRNVEQINQDVWKMTKEESKALNDQIASNIFKELVTKRPNLKQVYNTNTISRDVLNYQKQMLVKEAHLTNEKAEEFINQHENREIMDDALVKDTRKVEKGLH